MKASSRFAGVAIMLLVVAQGGQGGRGLSGAGIIRGQVAQQRLGTVVVLGQLLGQILPVLLAGRSLGLQLLQQTFAQLLLAAAQAVHLVRQGGQPGDWFDGARARLHQRAPMGGGGQRGQQVET